MMGLIENADLRPLNTLGFSVRARFLAEPGDAASLCALLRSVTARNLPVLILGGGSNVVFSGDFPGLVIRPAIKGIRIIEEDDRSVLVEAGAGVVWHDFVMHAVNSGLGGLENLALIPGTVGAAPVQNVGAYGVEIKDVMESLTAVNRISGEVRVFSGSDCAFGYRESIFKQQEKDRWVIIAVSFRLSKRPVLRLDYGDIRKQLELAGCHAPAPLDVARAVIAIRSAKLPDPRHLGNAGSFFKNPVVTREQYERLLKSSPALVAYPQTNGVKLAAGWLIEQCGFRGQRRGAVGCYEKQALVLVHFGGGSGHELLELAKEIQQAVMNRFGVPIEMEPSVY